MGLILPMIGCYTINDNNESIDVDPKTSESKALLDAGKYEEAYQQCSENLAKNPDNAEAWECKTRASSGLRNYTETISLAKETLRYNDKNFQVLNILGVAYMNLNKLEEALEAFVKATKVKPNDYLGWYNQAFILNNLGEYSQALEKINQGLKLEPEETGMLQLKGEILIESKKFGEAIRYLDRAISLQENVILWRLKGIAYYRQNKYEKALNSFDRAIKLDPKDVESWYAQAETLNTMGENQKACSSLREVKRLLPSHPKIT